MAGKKIFKNLVCLLWVVASLHGAHARAARPEFVGVFAPDPSKVRAVRESGWRMAVDTGTLLPLKVPFETNYGGQIRPFSRLLPVQYGVSVSYGISPRTEVSGSIHWEKYLGKNPLVVGAAPRNQTIDMSSWPMMVGLRQYLYLNAAFGVFGEAQVGLAVSSLNLRSDYSANENINVDRTHLRLLAQMGITQGWTESLSLQVTAGLHWAQYGSEEFTQFSDPLRISSVAALTLHGNLGWHF